MQIRLKRSWRRPVVLVLCAAFLPQVSWAWGRSSYSLRGQAAGSTVQNDELIYSKLQLEGAVDGPVPLWSQLDNMGLSLSV